jgi:hypothetical protein
VSSSEAVGRRIAGAVATALVLAAAGAGSAAGSAGTDLRIVLWPKGAGAGHARQLTLRCAPAGGTLPNPTGACRRLASVTAPFAPVPSNAVCTQVYAGPQVAVVSGEFRGRRIWARFARNDSCQAARWNRVSFLLPGAGTTGGG